MLILIIRSRPEVLCKKSALKNFTKFTGKHLCQSLLFNKVAGFRVSFRENTSGGLLLKRVRFSQFLSPIIVYLVLTITMYIVIPQPKQRQAIQINS